VLVGRDDLVLDMIAHLMRLRETKDAQRG